MIADGLKLTCDGGVGLAGLVVSRFYGKFIPHGCKSGAADSRQRLKVATRFSKRQLSTCKKTIN